jgi:hypothetical protein
MSEPKLEPAPYEVKHREQNDGVQRVYSNYMRGLKTGCDFRITFGEIIEIVGNQSTVEDRVAVTIAWPMVKDFCTWLQAHVADIERQMLAAKEGAVVDPDSVPRSVPGASTKIQ